MALRQIRHRSQTTFDRHCVAQGSAQPLLDPPPTRSGHGAIHHREQAGLAATVARVFEHLEVGERGAVHPQDVALLAQRDLAHVSEVALLHALGVFERGAGGDHHRFAVLEAEAAQRLDSELTLEPGSGSLGVRPEVGIDAGHADSGVRRPRHQLAEPNRAGGEVFGLSEHDFAGALSAEFFAGRRHIWPPTHHQGSRRGVQKGARNRHRGDLVAARPRERRLQGDQEIFVLALEKSRIGEGSWRDHARDLAPDEALGLRRILHLVADRHLHAGPQQLGEVGLQGMVRHAAHRRLAFGAAMASGESDLE